MRAPIGVRAGLFKNWAAATQKVVAEKLPPVSGKACGKVSPIKTKTPFYDP